MINDRRGDLKYQYPRQALCMGWLAFIITAAVLLTSGFVTHGGNRPALIAGAIILLASLVFIFPSFHILRKYGKPAPGRPYYDTTMLVQSGLYKYLRHPQYLGYMMLNIGFTMLSQHLIIAAMSALAIICLYVQTVEEEKYCLRYLGDSYVQYMKRVPRFNFLTGIFRRLRRYNYD